MLIFLPAQEELVVGHWRPRCQGCWQAGGRGRHLGETSAGTGDSLRPEMGFGGRWARTATQARFEPAADVAHVVAADVARVVAAAGDA